MTGQLHVRGREAGWADVGSEVHRHMQLQHGYVIPEGVELLKVWVSDNLDHRHLLGVLGVLVQLGVSQHNLVVLWGMGFAGGGRAHCHYHLSVWVSSLACILVTSRWCRQFLCPLSNCQEPVSLEAD